MNVFGISMVRYCALRHRTCRCHRPICLKTAPSHRSSASCASCAKKSIKKPHQGGVAMKHSLRIALAFITAALSPAVWAAADTVLVNGKIVTVDDRFNIVQALAIKDGRIVAAGKTADISKLADASTKKIDLKGKTVIPGL